MILPEAARDWIDDFAGAVPVRELERAVQALSDHYRARKPTAQLAMAGPLRVAAYLVSRFPATYAAVSGALGQLGDWAPSSLLDLGAGAGAASLAAQQRFPSVTTMAAVEADGEFLTAGRHLVPRADWRQADLREAPSWPPQDLVIVSYALGELPVAARAACIEQAWQATAQLLVLIEPGSPQGFSLIRDARSRLLEAGARMVAPCPSEAPCPMAGSDWCHFAQRLERSALHRRMKHASLSYEDEKFSYVAVSRTAAALPAARIIRRPAHHKGLIELQLCRGADTVTTRVPHKDRERFRAARKAAWGEPWEPR